jgi:hypothetical protein
MRTRPSLFAILGLTLALGLSSAAMSAPFESPSTSWWSSGKITVCKYNDLNGNGNKGGTEPSLSGWSFTLKQGSTVIATLTTDSSGCATKSELADGDYKLYEAVQPLWSNTDPGDGDRSVTLDWRDRDETVWFGNHYTAGTLNVHKYNDIDNDGKKDTGEPGLAGWTFTVKNSDHMVVASLTTDATGLATKTLAPGDYDIYEDTPIAAKWSNTDPGGENPKESVHLTDSDTDDVYFGNHYTPAGSLEVCKFNDLDGDGIHDDGEGMLAGWTFDVAPAILGLSALPEPIHVTTAGNGCGVIPSIAPGDYTVTEVAQIGWQNTLPTGGSVGVTVVDGQQAEATFGNTAIASLKLTSMCSVDPSETREWRVRNPNPFDVPFTWEVYPNVETGDGIADANSDVFFTTTTIEGPNTTKIYWNGGETVKASGGAACTGTLTIFKYNDVNNNGERDEGEPGLADWDFIVTQQLDSEVSIEAAASYELTTGSDPLGYASIELPQGMYTVCEKKPLPSRWANTEPSGGCDEIYISPIDGGQEPTVYFGNHYTPVTPRAGTLQVAKYNDLDRDGMRDPGEPGLAGFVFEIRLGGSLVTTITGNADGMATATHAAHTYTITEVARIGWTNTDPGGTAEKTATVVAGQTTDVMFGNAAVIIPPTSQTQLVITKYGDTNRSGTRDTGESGLAGFTFTIRDSAGTVVRTVVSGADGTVTVTGLSLGAYSISEEARTGWVNTDPGAAASARRYVTFTTSATSLTAMFGNAPVQLPSTATSDDAGTFFLLTLVACLALILPYALRQRPRTT